MQGIARPGAASGLAFPCLPPHTLRMNSKLLFILLGGTLLFSAAPLRQTSIPTAAPVYTSEGQLRLPEDYRDWIYLTSGFDMSYNPAMSMDHHMFDNVFVHPEAYRSFLQTGTWPDKTMLVLEVRGAQSKGSINKAGNYQGTTVMGLEVHVKDEARFPGKWAFFGFGDSKTATMIPQTADCYSCHANHAAVDTTFVQFYPTLLPIAKAKGTLSPSYAKEIAPATSTKDAPGDYGKSKNPRP
jgi:Cytochrome P460